VQEGGTGTICFGECTGYIKKVQQDEAGLRIWSWILMGKTNGHNTRIITDSGTLYQQQQRYFIPRKKNLTCLLILYKRDLIKQLQQWQEAGEKIFLFMDHNEHVTKGALGKALGDRDGLDLQEAIIYHTGKSPGATFFRGSKPINSIWVSNHIEISNACVMPFGYLGMEWGTIAHLSWIYLSNH
jgi:hypothetical protein